MFETVTTSITQISEQTKANMPALGVIALIPCVFYILNKLSHNRLLWLGIFPRKIFGLLGIVFSPVLHADFNHLFFNLIPLLVLSNFILIDGLPLFVLVTIIITFLCGFLTWCFGKPGVHIGASGLITGYWGFLVMNIVQKGTFTAIILGAISFYYFFGIFIGIFPAEKGVSWEGHFFGLMAGIITSYILELYPVYMSQVLCYLSQLLGLSC